MLKPLPVPRRRPVRRDVQRSLNDPEHYGSLSFRDAQTYQERTRVFDAFGWFREAGKNLTFAGEPHHVKGVAVTPALVQQLGVDPILGQWFQDETGVVISAPLWRRLGADSGIVGRSLTLDGRSYTVTGVMPDRSTCRSPGSRRREPGPTSGCRSIHKDAASPRQARRILRTHDGSRV